MIKVVKVLNLFSILLFAAVLLLVYAYLPIEVKLNLEEIGSIHKQNFFYYSIGIFLLANLILRLIINLGLRSWTGLKKAWLSLLIFCINVYFSLLVGFIGVLNNSTHISPESYSYLTNIGPVVLLFWLVGLIFLAFKK